MDYKQYNIFYNNFHSIKINFPLFNLEYYDEILYLINPKIIKTQINNNNFLVDVKEILAVDEKNRNSSSAKFDKKQKSLVNTDDKDSIKSKKNKGKLIKNKSNNSEVQKFAIISDDLFVNDSDMKPTLKLRKAGSKIKKVRDSVENKSSSKSFKSMNEDILDCNMNYSSKSSKDLFIANPLSIKDFSLKINLSEAEIITYLFLSKGICATVNEVLDVNMCTDLAEHYGFKIQKVESPKLLNYNIVPEHDFSANCIERPPIITILGHVDHGKTTLLDAILLTNLVDKEKGGITQSISAYEVFYQYNSRNLKLVFLDTPGHESFKSMRLRGARITDIVLLVIAVDDGLKPQTLESITYIKEMNLDCIIVLTKSDKAINNVQKIKEDLAVHNMLCVDWGGNSTCIEVSAANGLNIDNLLSKICSLAESQKLLANLEDIASGVIIDSFLDKKQGPISTLVIQNGTLKMGDVLVSDDLCGRIKSITSFSENSLEIAGPSSVVKVLCFSTISNAGSRFLVFKNEKDAKKYSNNYLNLQGSNLPINILNKRISINRQSIQKQLKLIIKADTQGSLEAIIDLLSNISQDKVQISIISASFGNITNNDINLSITTKSSILAFNVDILPQINKLIKKYKINFNIFYVIYDLLDYVESLMLSLVAHEYKMVLIGNAIVQTTFKMNKGFVAGCFVTDGKIQAQAYIYVYRKNILLHKGYITSLKYLKTDVQEVIAPSECGLMSDFQEWQQSDLIEAYDKVIKEKEL